MRWIANTYPPWEAHRDIVVGQLVGLRSRNHGDPPKDIGYLRPKVLWQGRHPHLWGATEFYLSDIIVLYIAFLIALKNMERFLILVEAFVDRNETVFVFSLPML